MTGGEPSIALCMIVKDEAQGLDRAISSAAPWVDQIVVVDTGSVEAPLAWLPADGVLVDRKPGVSPPVSLLLPQATSKTMNANRTPLSFTGPLYPRKPRSAIAGIGIA